LFVIIQGKAYEVKKCSRCGNTYDVDTFNRDTKRGEGRQRYCRSCSNRYGRANYRSQKERYFERNYKRSEIQRALPNDLSTADYARVLTWFNYSCALTGEKENVQQEHFIALATGHAGTIAGNIIPLAARLNASKHSKNPFTWYEEGDHDIDPIKWHVLVGYLASVNGLTMDEYRRFVTWCYDNPRTINEITQDGRTSLQIWKESEL